MFLRINHEASKKEAPDMALDLETLSQVSGGGKMPSGGTELHFPDNCPQCGAKLIKKRGAEIILPKKRKPTYVTVTDFVLSVQEFLW